MSSVKRETTYFNSAGKENTDTVLTLAKEYAEKENINDIIVASTTGETGAKASITFKGCNVVVVTHSFGFKELGKNELQEEFRKEILANGAKIFTGTHALSSAERAIRKNFGTIEPLELIANVLRLFGEGTKVCVEITLMAADAGLIPADKDVVTIGGSGRGADTALRIHPANTAQFFDLKIREVIAKPSNF
ncbi:MAG TPA: pyruvate kinase alpha/beta domain-containing protein [Candidatus Bathyarchaeia archaeon]|nr:pyruvate kinase alpha/beta domain-containing protein [Candidatus Bathyarchaeia archaeon]